MFQKFYVLLMMPITAEILKDIFTRPLPGVEAQKLMSPSSRFTGSVQPDPNLAKESSVFILLFQENGEWYIPLIKRTEYNGAHSGQISLPGGKREQQDKDILQTAYRETEEEIGISSDMITYIGTLTTLFIPNSNFNVIPHVGILKSTPTFQREPEEVEEIIKLPFLSLFNKAMIKSFERKINNHTINAPYYCCNEHIVWGATAMILSEFAEVIKESTLLKIF